MLLRIKRSGIFCAKVRKKSYNCRMNRTDRLQAILTHLQSKKVVTAQELADRFGLNIRTIYRDIRALEESGVPIGAEAGIGYFLSEGYSMRPVALTQEEASALVMGAKLISQNSDIEVNKDFESALIKIRSVLRLKEKQAAETLWQHIEVLGISAQNKNLHISEIQKAITERKILKIKYLSLKASEPVERMLECVGLCNYQGQWHLMAWCRLRKDYRDFRLDRIMALTITDLPCSKDDIITLKEFLRFRNPFGSQPNCSFWVPKDRHKYLSGYKEHYGFAYEEEDADGYTMHFCSDNLDSMAFVILNSGCMASSIEPPELMERVRFYARQTCNWYIGKGAD